MPVPLGRRCFLHGAGLALGAPALASTAVVRGAAGTRHLSRRGAVARRTGRLWDKLGGYMDFIDGATVEGLQAWEARFDRFVAALGGNTPRFINTFVNYHGDTQQHWQDSGAWGARCWNVTSRTKGIVPLVGIPMARQSDAAERDSIGAAESFFHTVAAGDWDATWAAIAASYRDVAPGGVVHFRLGYEHNGKYMPWYCGDTQAQTNKWIAAFQRITRVIRNVSGLSSTIHWNPNCTNHSPVGVPNTYPGDSYADVMAVDLFSGAYPLGFELWDWDTSHPGTNLAPDFATWNSSETALRHYWDYPAAGTWSQPGFVFGNPWAGSDPTNLYGSPQGWGIKQHLDFATARGKPIALGETGSGVNAVDGTGLNNKDWLPKYIGDRLGMPEGPEFIVAMIWDNIYFDGSYQFSGGAQPVTAEGWRSVFGF